MQNVLVYLGATAPADPSYTKAVQELGEGLAQRKKTLIFGGSKKGTMAILADAVLNNGGQAIGVFPKVLPMDILHKELTQTIITENLDERKTTMFNMSDAIIAMPGSFGTWDELFDALERVKIAKMHKRPVKPVALLNLNGYYNGVIEQLQRSIKEGYTTPPYSTLLYSAKTMDELLGWIDNLA